MISGESAISAPGTYKASHQTTITWENLSEGEHTLSAQLVNSDHMPLSPAVTTTITITVRQALAPPITIAPGIAELEASPKGANWVLVIALVAAVILITSLAIFMVRKTKSK